VVHRIQLLSLRTGGNFARRHFCFLTLLIFVSLLSAVTHAQTTPRSDADPGKIEDRIKRPATRVPEASAPKAPLLPEPYTEPVDVEGVFVLAGVEVIGATVYAEADFAPFYEPLMAREIKVSEVQARLSMIQAIARQTG